MYKNYIILVYNYGVGISMGYKNKTVLIYSSVPRLFRTTYIGHLYDIAQKYNVILVSERLDEVSGKAVLDPKLFPNMRKVVPVSQYTGQRMTLWESHKHFSQLAKKIITDCHPDIVIADSMINPFEKYLFRYGKLSGSTNVIFQAGFQIPSIEDEMKRQFLLWRDSGKNTNYNIKIRELKIYLTKIKQHLSELFDYWIFPVFLGTYPFFHKSLFKYALGPELNEIDYIVVFSDKEADFERRNGRSQKAIKILPHPLERKTGKIFDLIYHSSVSNGMAQKSPPAITIMLDINTFGHRKDDLSLIPENIYLKSRITVIEAISRIFPDRIIYIKPHPVFTKVDITRIRKLFANISKNIKIVNPQTPVDKFIEASDIIIGFPPPSTTLFTAMLKKNKLIIYIDLHHELLGDSFDGYEDVTYIDALDKLENILTKFKKHPQLPGKKYSSTKLYPQSAADIIDEIVSESY